MAVMIDDTHHSYINNPPQTSIHQITGFAQRTFQHSRFRHNSLHFRHRQLAMSASHTWILSAAPCSSLFFRAGDELVLFLMLTLSCPQVALSCCLSALMFFLFHLCTSLRTSTADAMFTKIRFSQSVTHHIR